MRYSIRVLPFSFGTIQLEYQCLFSVVGILNVGHDKLAPDFGFLRPPNRPIHH